ncbi:MAG: tetratricopeptide repeat protein [Desulfobulbaceae bacterium]|nr:tetratricopeptide repeat protein [Desulfobulbaceae bacterium]
MKPTCLITIITLFLFSGLGNAQAEEAVLFKDAGALLYEQGEYEKAYQHYFELFKEDPQDIRVNFFLGRAAFGMGNYEAAIMAFERVLIVDPGAVEVKIELGKSYYRLGSHETAIQYLEEALDNTMPDNVRKNVQAFLQQIRRGN